MARKALMIDYEYCTGCQSCIVACKQEHNYPVGKSGILLNEVKTEMPNGRLRIDFIPYTTPYCDLCAARIARGEKTTACAKHCQAIVINYGNVSQLAKEADKKQYTVMYTPR